MNINSQNTILAINWKIIDVIIVYILSVFLNTIIIAILSVVMRNSETIINSFLNSRNLVYRGSYIILILNVIVQLLPIFIVVIWLKFKKYDLISALGFKSRFWIKHLLIGVIFGFAYRSIVLIPQLIVKGGDTQLGALAFNSTNCYFNFWAFIPVIVASISESILFTGFTFPPFAKKFGFRGGTIITALLFVSAHGQIFYPQINLVRLVWFFIMEVVVINIYWWKKSLYAPIGFHLAYNILVVVISSLRVEVPTNASPSTVVQQFFTACQQGNWKDMRSLITSGVLSKPEMNDFQEFLNTEGIKNINIEVFEKREYHAEALITLITQNDKKIGIEPVELILQDGNWRIITGDTLPNFLKKENFHSFEEPYTQCKLGVIYINNACYEKAINAYKKAIAKDANCVEAYWGLGFTYAQLGQYYEAIKYFQDAVQLNSNSAELQYNLGAAYFCVGQYGKSIGAINAALRLQPNYKEAYFTRGRVYFKTGQYNNAIADFLKVIDLDEKHIDAYIGLAITYYQIGDKEKAIENYKKAIELDKRYAGEIVELQKESTFYNDKQMQIINEILNEIKKQEK